MFSQPAQRTMHAQAPQSGLNLDYFVFSREIARAVDISVEPNSQAPGSQRANVFNRGQKHQLALPKQPDPIRSEEHTSELQSLTNLVCRLLLEKKKKEDLHSRGHVSMRTRLLGVA